MHEKKHYGIGPVKEVKENKYQCNLCEKIFGSTGHLNLHLKKFHSDNANEKTFECKDCEKKFLRAVTLKRHEIKHIVGKPNHLNVIFVKKHSQKQVIWQDTKEFILVKNPMCVNCARNVSLRVRDYDGMKESIPEKSLMNANLAENLLEPCQV